jgi:hypothetical protein
VLIAEETLLVLTGDDGRARVDSTKLTYALAGAVLIELSLLSRVDVAGKGEATRPGRLVVRDPSPTGNPVLDLGLTELGKRANKKPRDVIRHLARGVREDVYTLLVDAGAVRREETRTLGIIKTTRYPVIDQATRQAIVTSMIGAVRGDAAVDARVSGAISLLTAIDHLHRVVTPEVTGMSKREIKRRGKEISEGSWAPKAVKDAVAAVNAAVMAGVVAATSVAAASS